MDKFVPLKQTVAFFLSAHKKSNLDFDRAWLLAFRGLRLLTQAIAAEPKTVRLPVEANKTVVLPDDYVAWTKIGVLNSQGEVSSLKINKALTKFRSTSADRLTKIEGEIPTELVTGGLYYNFNDNGDFCHLFGVGGGLVTHGECNVDDRHGVIILHPEFSYSDILLEYISNPERDSDYYVEGCLQEAIIAFIEWKMKLGTEEAFYARAIEGRRSLSNKRVTLQTINQVIRETGGMFLKS
jgi:hypothetical protein